MGGGCGWSVLIYELLERYKDGLRQRGPCGYYDELSFFDWDRGINGVGSNHCAYLQ